MAGKAMPRDRAVVANRTFFIRFPSVLIMSLTPAREGGRRFGRIDDRGWDRGRRGLLA
jgi:hypothetical protein